jgi:hypothetical protein
MATVQEHPGTDTGRNGETETRDRSASAVERLERREVRRSAEYLVAGFSGETLTAASAVVLAIIGLAGMFPAYLAPIATIIVGAAMLLKAGGVASRFAKVARETGDTTGTEMELVGGMSAELTVATAGIALGILALVGLAPLTLMAAAVIAFGGALLLGGGETYRVSQLGRFQEHTSTAYALRAAAASAAGAETLVGITAVVLGIIAIIGMEPMILVLVGLLSVAGAQMLTGVAESGRLAKILRS